jgi:hypothetical protein
LDTLSRSLQCASGFGLIRFPCMMMFGLREDYRVFGKSNWG